jgi:MFS family permease
MGEISEKLRNVLIVATLGLATIAVMGDMVIIPVAGNLFADFSGVNIGVLNYILSGPALIGALSSLFCGKLTSYIEKKQLLIIAFIFFMIGGIGGDLVHNAYYMAAMRTVVGIGKGGITVLLMAIISDVFINEKARSSVMGIYNGLMAGVGTLLGWISGIVATIKWTLVFRIYLASIPVFLLILIFIPSGKTVNAVTESGPVGTDEKMPWLKLLLLDGALFVYNAIYCSIAYYQISMVISEKALGDVSFIGMCAALSTVGSFVFCCFFGLYYNKCKRFTPFIGFTGLALGFFLLYIAQTTALAAFSFALLGGMYGLGFSYYLMYCTVIVPPSYIPMSISITATVLSIATFLSTYISLLLQSILGVSITGVIPFLVIVLAIGAVLSLIAAIKSRKRPQEAAV